VLISVADDVIKVLADPLRAEIVRLLADGPACPCHLVADTGATQPNISNHLRALRHAGVVAAERRGRFTFYRLEPDVIDAAAGQLSGLAQRARETADARRDC
jgi:ArsR family transcriptional regulator